MIRRILRFFSVREYLGDSGGPLAVYDMFNDPILIGVVRYVRLFSDDGDENLNLFLLFC